MDWTGQMDRQTEHTGEIRQTKPGRRADVVDYNVGQTTRYRCASRGVLARFFAPLVFARSLLGAPQYLLYISRYQANVSMHAAKIPCFLATGRRLDF